MLRGQRGQALAALAALAVVMLGAGCSGTGTQPGAGPVSSAQELADTHMTTVELLRSWLGVMYPQAGPPGQPVVQSEQVDPDTWHSWGTDGYGHAFDFHSHSDGSGNGNWLTPDGEAASGTWGPTVETPNPKTVTQHLVFSYPEMTLTYDTVAVYPQGGGLAALGKLGTARLTDGRSLQFEWHNNATDQETLHLVLPAANADVQLQVPVGFVANRGWRPRPGQPATGTAQTEGGAMALSLQGDDGNWRQWDFTGPDGTTASFTLTAKMAGSGRLEKDNTLVGVLTWPDTLVGRLDLTSLGTVEVTPSAAARDLAIEQWLSQLAALGPGALQ